MAHLPHGMAVTVVLEVALPWNVEETGAYREVAQAFGVNVTGLPAAFSALLDEAELNEAVHRTPDVQIDPEALAALMRAPENLPMLTNNARLGQPDDDLWLAQQTAKLWQQRRRITAHA